MHRSEILLLMSGWGQTLPKFDVRVRSAYVPTPTKSRHFGFGPISGITPTRAHAIIVA